MRILGIDPGLTRCGICVLDAAGARRISLVSVGVARTDPQMAPHQRLLMISQELEETIHAHRPDVVAVERVFAQDNVRSVMSTAQVVGIVLLAAAKASLPVGMHSPSEVKAAVTGNGRAQKSKYRLWCNGSLGWISCRARRMPLMRSPWLSAMPGAGSTGLRGTGSLPARWRRYVASCRRRRSYSCSESVGSG